MGRKLYFLVSIPLLASCHLLSRLADFQDIVRQRKNGNNIAQVMLMLAAQNLFNLVSYKGSIDDPSTFIVITVKSGAP